MNGVPFSAQDLQEIYKRRFEATQIYRNRVWKILTTDFFQRYISTSATILDLGCGYGDFINNIQGGKKYGMDLNPAAAAHLNAQVLFLQQSCSERWALEEGSLDAIFTSNFFEHLPNKTALSLTLREARRCLKQAGRLICLGPNIRHLPGKYWDFWDHHLPLTELSLKEGLETHGFAVEECRGKFLPYTMVNVPRYPLFFLRVYLRCRFAWPLFGRQFLVIARG
jgi:SAM-dependent methyltransferase